MAFYGFKSVNDHNGCNETIELISMSRSLLRRISKGQSRSQNNRLPGARARDGPKRGRHTRHCPIMYLRICRLSYSRTTRHFVVLGGAPERLEYVLALSAKR